MEPYEDWGICLPGVSEKATELIVDLMTNEHDFHWGRDNPGGICPRCEGICCYNRDTTRKLGKALKEEFGGNLKFTYNLDPN